MHEYAFDIKMFAIVRVKAQNEKQARKALDGALDCAYLNLEISDPNDELKITEASIHVDDELGPYLFEIDGETTE